MVVVPPSRCGFLGGVTVGRCGFLGGVTVGGSLLAGGVGTESV